MSSLFTPNSYIRGVESSENLLPDPSLELQDAGALPYATSNSALPNVWSLNGYGLGTGGAYAAVVDDTFGRDGSKSLRISLSTAGAPDNWVTVLSPHIDVIPGETYLFAGWGGKTESTTAKSYFRVAAGSTDAFTEYTGTSTYGLTPQLTWENQDLPDIGTEGAADYTLMTRVAQVVTIPAGIYRAAIRLYNYKPASGSTHYWDSFEVYRLTGPGAFTGDTGWVSQPINATHAAVSGYPLQIRRVGTRVNIRGMVQWTSGAVTDIFATVPLGFRPSTATWLQACHGNDTARTSLQPLVNSSGSVYVPVSYYSGTPAAPFLFSVTGSWFTD